MALLGPETVAWETAASCGVDANRRGVSHEPLLQKCRQVNPKLGYGYSRFCVISTGGAASSIS